MKRLFIIEAALVMLLALGSPTPAQEAQIRARARNYEPYIATSATRHDVDARLLWTIAYLEARFQPGLVSPKGARGLMQFMPGTAARYGLSNPLDPVASIDAAARYVRFLTERFGGRVDLILAGYNAGEGAVDAYRYGRRLVLSTGKVINPSGITTGGVPPYRETQSYVTLGASVFMNITEARMFNAAPLIRQQPQVMLTAQVRPSQPSKPTPAETVPPARTRHDSFYIAASVETEEALTKINVISDDSPPPSSATQSPTQRPKTRSIYFQE